MDESFSSFTVRGGWVAIVEHGERITRALRDEGVSKEQLERWAEWRPKAHERLREDVAEKTAQQGTVQKKTTTTEDSATESEDHTPEASEPVGTNSDEPNCPARKNIEKSSEKRQKLAEETTQAPDSAGRKALRAAERTVYETVIRKAAPYSFNADVLSASIERIRNENDSYVFKITVKDHDLKQRVSARLSSYNEIERWHVDTEKNTETAEAAEGAELTKSETDSTADSDIEADFKTT